MWFFLALVNVASPIFPSVLPPSFSVPAGEALACSYFKREQFMFSPYVSLPLLTSGGYLGHVRVKMRHASIFEAVVVMTCHRVWIAIPHLTIVWVEPSKACDFRHCGGRPAVCCVGRLRTRTSVRRQDAERTTPSPYFRVIVCSLPPACSTVSAPRTRSPLHSILPHRM